MHLVLFLAWRLVANRERKTRTDGKLIPYYYTGNVGNLVGFSLVAYALGKIAPSLGLIESVASLTAAGALAVVLDMRWRRVARTSTVSLYTREGVQTLAGTWHFAYVLIVTALCFLAISNVPELSTFNLVIALSGLIVYTLTVSIDRVRGVI